MLEVKKLDSGLITVGKPEPSPEPPKLRAFVTRLNACDLREAIQDIFSSHAELLCVFKIKGLPKANFLGSHEYQVTYLHTKELSFAEKC